MEERAVPLFAEERKRRILQMLAVQSKIYVPRLCEIFGVSQVTIRSDLQELEQAGLLKRTHGGAISVGRATYEPNSQLKEVAFRAEKRRIARYAADLVEPGDTIALDTGTSTFEMAKCLAGKPGLTVITNDLQIASFLEMSAGDSTVIMLGGILRRGFHCTVGPAVIGSTCNLNVDKSFMATNAFSLEKDFTTPSMEQAEVKQALISIASQAIMLVDSSKFGKVSLARFAALSEFGKLITDTGLYPEAEAAIRAASKNTELILV